MKNSTNNQVKQNYRINQKLTSPILLKINRKRLIPGIIFTFFNQEMLHNSFESSFELPFLWYMFLYISVLIFEM